MGLLLFERDVSGGGNRGGDDRCGGGRDEMNE
jgi:hypothetical protein